MNGADRDLESLLNWPATLSYSFHDRSVTKATSSAEFPDGYDLVAIAGVDATASVAVLLLSGRPAAIAGLIAQAVVDAVE
jgi:hypothetical protein